MPAYEPTVESLHQHPVPRWFADAKLGILVHWGPSSVPGWAPLGLDPMARGSVDGWEVAFRENAYAEWYWNTMSLDGSPTERHHKEEWGGRPYEEFAGDFDAASSTWDPVSWAQPFAAAGARYVVLTTKHHDGYLLWPSRHPNPHIDGWQSQRDIVGDITDAVRAEGMEMGLYYSGGIDWTFTGLPISDLPSMFRAIPTSDDYAAYADAHWRELIERYRPAVLWNDIGYPQQAGAHQLFVDYYATIPEGIVNDRFDMLGVAAGTAHADFRTPEYAQMDDITTHHWESVRGISHSFGYNQLETDTDLASPTELVHLLVDIVSKNGNLLLGVGPMGDGSIPAIQQSRLTALGSWLDVNGEAIFGTRPWAVPASTTGDGLEVRYTTRDGDLFATILGTPTASRVAIHGLVPADGTRVSLLGGTEVPFTASPAGLAVELGLLPPESPAHCLRIHPAPTLQGS